MKNIPAFLRQRELGKVPKFSQEKKITEEFLENRAANPEVNQACELSGQCRATFLMDFSPDGTKVASTHGDHSVRVSDLSTGKCTHILHGHPRTPWCLSFHPSSDQILASGCLAGEVRIWDLHGGGSEVWQCKDNQVVASLTFHPTDHVLVFAVGNGIYFWDWNQPEPFACCQTRYDYERIRLVRFDSLGQFLYTGIANNTMIHSSSSNVSFNNGRNNPVTVSHAQRPQLRNMYTNLVNCYQAYQRDRVRLNGTSTGLQGSDAERASERNNRSRRSPVHEEGLNYARQYAAHVTESSRPSAQASHHGAQNLNDAERPESSPRLHRPYVWSPPPRGASSAEDVVVQDGTPPETGIQRSNDSVGNESSSGTTRESSSSSPELSSSGAAAHSQPPSQVMQRGSLHSLEDRLTGVSPSEDIELSALSNRTPPLQTSMSNSAPEINSADRDPVSALLQLSNQMDSSREGNRTRNTTGSSSLGLLPAQGDSVSSVSSESSTRNESSNRPSTYTAERLAIIERNRRALLSHSQRCRRMLRPMLQRDTLTTGTVGVNYNSHCDDAFCQICRNFNRSQLRGGRHGPYLSYRSRLHSGLSTQRTTDSRSAFTQMYRPYSNSGFNANDPNNSVNRCHRTEVSDATHSSDESDQSNPSIQQQEDRSNQLDAPSHNGSASTDAVLTDSSEHISGRGYEQIQNNFATITARIEREMNELDRRITALRNSFNESIQQLHQDRDLYPSVPDNMNPSQPANTLPNRRSRTPANQLNAPVITITRCRDSNNQQPATEQDSQQSSQDSSPHTDTGDRLQSVPPEPAPRSVGANLSNHLHHLLETPLSDASRPLRQRLTEAVGRESTSASSHPGNAAHQDSHAQIPRGGEASSDPSWHSLQRHHLHPHYYVSIFDDTINRPYDGVQNIINRAIAGAFMGRGEPAVANNIVNQTHRIQVWDFNRCEVPDISDASVNVIVPHCKLHNEASCDISQDRRLLATFVPSHRGFPDDNILAVYSLDPETKGQCLYTKSFGPNAISVSLSPRNTMVMVGLAAKRLSWVITSSQMVAQIYRFQKKQGGEKSMKQVADVMHPCDVDVRTHVSVNSARWLPQVGGGIVYGTNRGDLHICRPGAKKSLEKESTLEHGNSASSIRRNLMHMLGLSSGTIPLISIGTQTSARRSAGTQTDTQESEI